MKNMVVTLLFLNQLKMFNWIKNKINKKLKREHNILVGQNIFFYESCVYAITGEFEDYNEDYNFEDTASNRGNRELLSFIRECNEKVKKIVSKGDPPYSHEDAGILLDINREYMTIYMEDTYGLFPGNYLESFPDKFTPVRYKLNLDDDDE